MYAPVHIRREKAHLGQESVALCHAVLAFLYLKDRAANLRQEGQRGGEEEDSSPGEDAVRRNMHVLRKHTQTHTHTHTP
jgi:hypothetical protein